MMPTSLIDSAEIRTRRILIVDDEHANVLLLASVLEREGYRDIHTVTNPAEALESYIRLEPDLVLVSFMEAVAGTSSSD